jgi:hypothetical protein
VLNAKQTIAREIKRRSLGKDEEDELELDLEEGEEYITQAKNKLVGLTSSEFQDLNKGLVERLASTETYYELYTIDEFGMEAFRIEKKIFPLEDEYNISKLESAIRAVLNKGKLGGVFLAHFYELEDFLDNKFEGSDGDNESELGYIG